MTLPDPVGVPVVPEPLPCKSHVPVGGLFSAQPTTEGFFEVSVAIPFLDNLRQQLTQRFTNSDLARDGLLLVPANIVEHYPNGCMSAPEGIKCLATLWEEDLENINLVEAEFIRWCDKWNRENAKENPVVPSSLTEAIKECKVASFANLHKLLHLVLTLPITTAECERSMSRLRTLKTYLHPTMGSDRFNGLTLMRMHHRNYPVDVMAAVDTSAKRFRTKMALLTKSLLNEENIDNELNWTESVSLSSNAEN